MSIYYICPEYATPVGGVRVIYRHVEILNKNGISAYVVHKTRGFRATWFHNETPIVYWRNNIYDRLIAKVRRHYDAKAVTKLNIRGGRSDAIDSRDIIAVPEIFGPDLAIAYGRGISKVVLNQGCYLTFNGYSWQRDRLTTPYQHEDVIATLVNSHDGEDYLRYAFPEHQTLRFRVSIDPERFSFQSAKKRQICFSLIKNQSDALQVINILKFRSALRNFDLVPFINLPQSEVAKIYKESLIFLNFGYQEGFGLPPAEAMACGCIVIGFHGGGGREFFNPDFSYPIVSGDVIAFAKTVAEVISIYDENPGELQRKGRLASEFVLNQYSPQLEEAEVLSAWRSIILRHEVKE